MKKIGNIILFLMATIILMGNMQVKAQEIVKGNLCRCKEKTYIYEKPELTAGILGEKETDAPVFVTVPGTTWSQIFFDGKEAYVLSECLGTVENESLAEDEAFAWEELIKENEESLSQAHKTAMDEDKGKRIVGISCVVGIVTLFIGVDFAAKSQKTKKAKLKKGDKNA